MTKECFLVVQTPVQVAENCIPRDGTHPNPQEWPSDGCSRCRRTNLPLWRVFEGKLRYFFGIK